MHAISLLQRNLHRETMLDLSLSVTDTGRFVEHDDQSSETLVETSVHRAERRKELQSFSAVYRFII